MNERKCGVAALLLAAVLTGCAAEPEQRNRPDENFEPVGKAGCFFNRQVSSFKPLDRRNLIVYAPGRNNAYHVRISPPSIDLRSADVIAFESRSSRICGYAGDDLILGDGPFEKFSVTDVHRLDADSLEYLLTLYGKGPEQMETEESPAADVERDIEPDESNNKENSE